MIFRTKVLGGGGYNVAKNGDTASKNNQASPQKLKDNSQFLQSGKNCNLAAVNKNQSTNEIYKTKSNKLFRAALLSVWLLHLCYHSS